jgi:predicted RNA binding protein YcfA (HicA-like mRNA interferase family)
MASPVRLAVVTKMLQEKGFFLHHVSGSHHVFKRADGQRVVIPVHHNLVKDAYVRQIKKLQG